MQLNLERTAPGTCANGTGVWYVCTSNGFTGCCTVNPCDLPACPDTASSSSSAVAISTALSTSTAVLNTASSTALYVVIKTLTAITESAAPATTSASSSSSTSTPPTATSTFQNAGIVIAATSSSSASPPPASAASRMALIAGVVAGIFVLSIISILAWFCIRRCQQSKVKNTRKSYGLLEKDFVLDRSKTDLTNVEAIHKTDGDVFAVFGGPFPLPFFYSRKPSDLSLLGRYKSPKAGVAEMSPIPVHGSEHDLGINQDNEHRPLPDIEKSAVTTTPVRQHPAYHAPPVQSPETAIHCPGRAVHTPATVEHPAYYTSQTAFSVPMARITDVQEKYNSYAQRSGAAHGYSSHSRHASFQATPLSPQIEVSPIISSPIPEYSELEAEVPASFITPLIIAGSRRYKQYRGLHKHHPNQSEELLSRYPAKGSKNNSPIGLGVSPSASTPNLPLPSTFVPASRTSIHAHSHSQSNSRPSNGEEIISQMQIAPNLTSLRPIPRSSQQSLRQDQPIMSHLQTSHIKHSTSHVHPSSTHMHSFSWSSPSYLHASSSSSNPNQPQAHTQAPVLTQTQIATGDETSTSPP